MNKTSLRLAIVALMKERTVAQAALNENIRVEASAANSWQHKQERAETLKEHGIKQDNRGWNFTPEDAARRDGVLAAYKTEQERYKITIQKFDQAVLDLIDQL